MRKELSNSAINRLAVPAIIAGIAEPILSLTDSAVIGNIPNNSAEALNAVGVVGAFLSFLIWSLGQSRSAFSSIISQYLGANKLNEIKNLPFQGFFIVVTVSLVFALASYPFATEIFSFMNAKDLVLDYSLDYYKIRIFGLPLTLLTIGIFGVFRGLQNTYYPMIIATVGALLNIVLDIVLVYGIDGYISPLHIKGAAYASVISQAVMTILAIYFFIIKTHFKLKFIFPWNKEIPNFLKMIGNLFIRSLSLNVAAIMATQYATGIDEFHGSAYSLTIQIWLFCAFILDGYASVGNILSGKFYGEKNIKDLVLLKNILLKFGIVVGLILIVFNFLMYYPFGLFFTNDDQVRQAFYKVFWIAVLMQPFCAIAFVFDGMYKGMGKMVILRNLLIVSTFLGFIPTLFILDKFNFKLHAIWLAFFVWIIIRAIILNFHFKKNYEQKKVEE